MEKTIQGPYRDHTGTKQATFRHHTEAIKRPDRDNPGCVCVCLCLCVFVCFVCMCVCVLV